VLVTWFVFHSVVIWPIIALHHTLNAKTSGLVFKSNQVSWPWHIPNIDMRP